MATLYFSVSDFSVHGAVMMVTDKRNSWSIFLLLIVALNINGWRPFKVTIKNLTWECGNLINVNGSLSQSNAINAVVDIKKDINHPFAHTEVYADSGSGQYDFEILNRTVNICEFFRNKNYEPLLQIIYKILLETGSLPTACPIRKSRLTVENFIVDAEKLPPYLPERKGYVRVKLVNEEDGFRKDLCTVSVFFEVENKGIDRMKNVTKKKN